MSEGRRIFGNLPALERHRRLISRHCQDATTAEGSLPSAEEESIGFFSPEEEEAIRHHHQCTVYCLFVLCQEMWFRFIRSADESTGGLNSWASRLAKKYYDRLFKEYCIVDLSLYEYGCLGTRWRTENEVKIGKGQFTCASTKCNDHTSLGTYEINFSYSENGSKKEALVKVRLCPECVQKMNYKRTVLKKQLETTLQKKSKKRRKERSKNTNVTVKKKKSSKHDHHSQDGKDQKSSPLINQEETTSDDCLDDLFV